MKFDNPRTVQSLGSSRVYQFSSTEALSEFAEREGTIWAPLRSVGDYAGANVRDIARGQGTFFQSLSSILAAIETNMLRTDTQPQVGGQLVQLDQLLQRIRNGEIFTSDSPGADAIIQLMPSRLDEAAYVLFLLHPNAVGALAHFNSRISVALLLRSLLAAARSSSEEVDLSLARAEYQRTTSKLEDNGRRIDDESNAREGAWVSFKEEVERQGGTWSKRFVDLHVKQKKAWKRQSEAFSEEWSGIKRQLEESVSLAAPTKYWKSRAASLTIASVAFFLAFAGSAGFTLYLFVEDGMPYLQGLHQEKVADHVNTILAIIPLVVPAFAAVWLLRMLGRLFATYARLSEDARERKTMVETFLALSREGADGKALLMPEDRQLILKALFRPSDGTGVDDSPPMGIVEAVVKKAT